MNNKKITIVLTLLLCISTCLCVFVAFRKKNPSQIIKINDGNSQLSINDPKNIFFNIFLEYILPSEGFKVNPYTTILDTTLQAIEIKKLVTKPSLIFRFSDTDCDMCVNTVLKQIKDSKSLPKEQVYIILDGYSDREFPLKSQSLNLDMSVFNIVPQKGLNGLGLPIEKRGLPFLFLLDTTFNVSNLFCPFKEYPKQTETYLAFVSKKISL